MAIAVKIGSSLYLDEAGKFNKEMVLSVSGQLAKLKRQGIDSILVTSGAVACCPINGLSRNLKSARLKKKTFCYLKIYW